MDLWDLDKEVETVAVEMEGEAVVKEDSDNFWDVAPICYPGDANVGPMFRYATLSKLGLDDKIHYWEVGFDITKGLLMRNWSEGGKKTIRPPTQIDPKNKTIIEKAVEKATRRFINMQKKGYQTDDFKLPPHLQNPQPMLAEEFDPKKITEEDWSFGLAASVKLDGMRCISHYDRSTGVRLTSRENNAITFKDHIREELEILFSYLPSDCRLDGELFNFNLPQKTLKSIYRSSKNLHPWDNLLGYYIFDIIEPMDLPFLERYRLLLRTYKQANEEHVFTSIFLLGMQIVHSEPEVTDLLNAYRGLDQEGVVVRFLHPNKSNYEKAKRSHHMLKVKCWVDEDVKVVDVLDEAKGTEYGAAMLSVVDRFGLTLTVRPRGKFDIRREWLQNPSLVVGKRATMRYAYRTSDNIPYHVVITEIRDYE